MFFLRGVDLLRIHAGNRHSHYSLDARLHGHVDEVAEHIVDRGERLVFVLLALDLGEADVVAHRHVLRVVHRPREVVFLRKGNGHVEVGFQRRAGILILRQMLGHRRGEGIALGLRLFGELRRAALGVHCDRALRMVRVKAGDLAKLVDAHVRGVVAVINVDAHDAVRNARQRQFGIVDDRRAVRNFKFQKAAAQHVLRAVTLLEQGKIVLGERALGVHQDEVAHILLRVKIGDRVIDLVRRHADARGQSDAHDHHEDDGDETGVVAAEHAPKRL